MIVKVGKDSVVQSSDHPIIVMFDDDELEQIRNFDPGQNVLYSYPVNSDPEQVRLWVEERINQEPYPESNEYEE
ncbi:MAG: hypothetical protein R3250_05510 [Melioribacteraceae bacterium]|nr:hypothetical protein [Melioribacteraceae bacterium]